MEKVAELLVAAVVGALVGGGGVSIAFSVRLAVLEKAHASLKSETDRRFDESDVRYKQAERRQLATLDLLTAIARKLDVNHRYTDLIAAGDA